MQARLLTFDALRRTLAPLADAYPGFADQLRSLHHRVALATIRDLNIKRKAMARWSAETSFVPKPSSAPDPSAFWTCEPVREYKIYHGRAFVRDRHCAGVTFATMAVIGGELLCAVWTRARQAYVFAPTEDGACAVRQVIDGQDDPFETWLHYLGGTDVVRREEAADSPVRGLYRRSAAELFHDMVVPYFGTHRHARSLLLMRAVSPLHVVWSAVKAASYATADVTEEERLQWRLLM